MTDFIDPSWLGGIEEYKFYGGEVTLFYDDKEHKYTRYDAANDRELLIPGVTSVVGVVDKSAALMQWAANLTAEYILEQAESATGEIIFLWLEAWCDKARFAHRDYKENAADIGKIAHNWLEQYIKRSIQVGYLVDESSAVVDPMPENEQSRNGCIAAINWMVRHKVRWLHTERKIYSRKYEFAGTTDGLAYVSSCGDAECCGHWVKKDGRWVREALHFENVLAVIDWKTSNSLHDSYDWQTAAYTEALQEEIGVHSEHPELAEPIRYRIVARLGKDDAQWEARLLTPATLGRDFRIFLACLALYNQLDAVKEEDKAIKKELRMQAKNDRLTLACAKSKTFKGFRFPKCNGGDPCKACLDKYYERHPQEKAA